MGTSMFQITERMWKVQEFEPWLRLCLSPPPTLHPPREQLSLWLLRCAAQGGGSGQIPPGGAGTGCPWRGGRCAARTLRALPASPAAACLALPGFQPPSSQLAALSSGFLSPRVCSWFSYIPGMCRGPTSEGGAPSARWGAGKAGKGAVLGWRSKFPAAAKA